MFEKSVEYWLALIGAAIYVALRDSEKERPIRRVLKLLSAGAITLGLSNGLAEYMNIREAWAAVALMVLGQIMLDLLTALVGDRNFMKDLIRSWLGKGQNNG